MTNSGFSLIELLVVVAIMSVLASVGMVGYVSYIDTTRDEVTLSDFYALEDILVICAGPKTGLLQIRKRLEFMRARQGSGGLRFRSA